MEGINVGKLPATFPSLTLGTPTPGTGSVFHMEYNKSYTNPMDRYLVPETGYSASVMPRSVGNFGGTLVELPAGQQYLTGDAIIKERTSKKWKKAQINTSKDAFLLARGQEFPEIQNNKSLVSIFQASPEIMFTTNMIWKIEDAKDGDEIVFVDGVMVLAKSVTKLIFEASTGITVVDDAEAVAKSKEYAAWYVFNDRQEAVTDLVRINPNSGAVPVPPKKVMIKRI